MPQSSTVNVLPISNSELTKKPESKNYNWKTLTKAGLVFVATTGAFLTLKTTGSFNLISSWLKNKETDFDEQETKLAVHEEAERVEAYSEYQKTGLSLTGFGPSEVLQTDTLRLTNFKESSLAVVKDSHQHIAFMPQKVKRNPMGILEKIGPEFQVNTHTTNDQTDPSIAGLSDGKFIVTWDSDGQDGSDRGVYGQMFNADGSKFLSEFQVNTYKTSYQAGSSVAGLGDGKFVVTWTSYGQDGDNNGIYGQMFNADGSKYLSEFRVNTYTIIWQEYSSVAGLGDGKFVVTWTSYQDGSGFGIYGQMFNADGTKYSSEFQVNSYIWDYQYCPSIAGLSDGKFIVVWRSDIQDGGTCGIYGQMYNADGSKFSSEFRVNTYTVNDQEYPSVARLNDGKFVITWVSDGQDGSGYGVYGQMFNANGSKYGSEFQVNTYTTGDQSGPYTNPPVVGLSDGKFVVTWQSLVQDGDLYGIYGQMYNADGSKFLSEFQVNTYTISWQEEPSVAGLSDGKFVVTWQSSEQDGDGYGIYGQMFRANETFVSSYLSSSQQIPESSSEVSNYSPTVSSPETSSFTTTSNTEISSYSSKQSTSSAKRSSLSQIIPQSSLSSLDSIKTSGSYNSISSTLETFSSTEPTSSAKSTSYSPEISSSETSSLSEEPIYSDSIHDEGLSSGEITGIVLGTIATVGLCIAGGFFAVRRICKSDRDQSIEDIELDPTIPKTFRCSLTGKMMNEPVEIAGERDCFYDREAIEQYFAREHKSPSGKSLKTLVLIPNYDLRSKIDEYRETLEPSAPQLEV